MRSGPDSIGPFEPAARITPSNLDDPDRDRSQSWHHRSPRPSVVGDLARSLTERAGASDLTGAAASRCLLSGDGNLHVHVNQRYSERAVRTEVLRSLGADQGTVEELAAYCENPFPLTALPASPVLPLQDEAHTTDWRDYLSPGPDDLFGFLQQRLVQLNIPIKQGISKTDAYADIVRRGKPFSAETFGGRLTLERPELLRASVNQHPAGALPVLRTSHRPDFVTMVRALAFRCEPHEISPAVNAQMISGLINWDRMRRYRSAWLERHPDEGHIGWPAEMTRVSSSEQWRFLDRLIVVTDSPYSGASAVDLGLELSEAEWREGSALLRLEHEFTHYATKRLYGKMALNVLDEIIADWAGMSSALGEFRAAWFARFLGLENLPEVRAGGRIHTYRRDLSDDAFRVLGRLTVKAAEGLEALHRAHYTTDCRERFLLALTRLTLDLLASEERDRLFSEAYEWAGGVLQPRHS